MRYYRRKANQKVRAVLLRILFVIVCAAVILGLAVFTGNLLKRHVEAASERLDSAKPPSGNAVSRKDAEGDGNTGSDSYSSLTVNACGIDWITRTADGLMPDAEDALVLRLKELAADYDTVSIPVNDADGYYYTSPALLSFLHQPLSADALTDDSVYKRLTILCSAVKAENLRFSVRILASLSTLDAEAAAILDGTVAKELFAMGADEVLFTGLMPADADTDAINYARTYLENVREEVGDNGTIGALLPHRVYTEAVYAKQVQMAASAVDFLAIDLSDAPVSTSDGNAMTMTISKICQSLRGSFQVYNMRVYLGSHNATMLATQTEALDSLGLRNRQYEMEISSNLLDEAQNAENSAAPVNAAPPGNDETTMGTESPADPDSHVNPYAVTRPQNTAEGGENETETTETETEDLTYRSSDDDSWY